MAVSWKITMPKGKQTSDGKGRLHLQIIIDRRKKVKSLGITLFPKFWVEKLQKVAIPIDKEKETLINAILQKHLSSIETNYYKCVLNEIPITFDRLLKEDDSNSQGDFYDYFEERIEKTKSVTKGTRKKWQQALNVLKSFKDRCFFKELKLQIIKDFDGFMVEKKYATNTRAKHHSSVKRMINEAIKDKLTKENPYKDFRIQKAKTIRTFLEAQEVKRLIELYESDVLSFELQNVLRQFLFCCFGGGFRICDWKRLKKSCIIENDFVFQPQKSQNTRMLLRIPLNNVAFKLIEDGQGIGDNIFRVISDQKTNKHLKKIAAFANIKKNLTCHVARHTYAMMFLSIGGKLEVLKEILGHSDIATTMVYVHISEEQKRSQIALMDGLWKDYPRAARYTIAPNSSKSNTPKPSNI